MGLHGKIAVITPYCSEPKEVLGRCVDSVNSQTIKVDHFLVSDGVSEIGKKFNPYRHVNLGVAHKDWGNTPRALGAMLAISEEYDAISFLDADNWYDPTHIEKCVSAVGGSLSEASLDYVIARRRFLRPDATEMVGEVEEADHVDTNCFFLLRGAFPFVPIWGLLPKDISHKGDRYFYQTLKRYKLSSAVCSEPTVNYTYCYPGRYIARGESLPTDCRDVGALELKMQAFFRDIDVRSKVILSRILR